MAVPVTALYGSLNAILNIALAIRVSNQRTRDKVALGTGDAQESALLVRIRTHANNAEFVPLAILMLLIAELSGGASVWLHVIGGSLLAARIAHVPGMERPAPNAARLAGNLITWLDVIATSIWVLWLRSK
ncbi:MAG: MAPEG family protein [Labilithrix sp.]|nr:MAPEG family protein [Labilithrix sp.]